LQPVENAYVLVAPEIYAKNSGNPADLDVFVRYAAGAILGVYIEFANIYRGRRAAIGASEAS
jgi:hypothetical protein